MPTDIRLSLKALRAFAAVVDHGSITAAARALNTVPSAVAASLDQVEATFGADLLIRTRSKGIAATPEGREMAARFRDLLEDYSTVMQQGRDIARQLTGTLRIGYYAPVAPAFLPGILRPMLEANPDLRLDLRAHDNDSAQAALLSGQLDVIIFAGQDVRSGIDTSVLLGLRPYVLTPENHDLAARERVTLADVVTYPLIQLERPMVRAYFDRLFQSQKLQPHITARTDDTEMVRALVGAGLGLAVLHMRPLTSVSYGGDGLCAVPLDQTLPGLQLLSGHVAGKPRRLVSAFLDALHAWMASDQAQHLIVTGAV